MTFLKQNNFSVRKRLSSFKYAIKGIQLLIKYEHNTRIHLFATFCVVIAGIILKVRIVEWSLLVIVIGMVYIAEIFNTVIEHLTDLISPQFNKNAQIIKDLGAGGVLISAIIAFIIGLVIFLPKILALFY